MRPALPMVLKRCELFVLILRCHLNFLRQILLPQQFRAKQVQGQKISIRAVLESFRIRDLLLLDLM